MSLEQLDIKRLRNLQQVRLQPGPRLNVLSGANGSGKTSLLEAIHLLSLGRSFRTHRLKAVMQHEAEAFAVHGRIRHDDGMLWSVGFERRRDEDDSRIQLQGRRPDSLVELARLLPVQVINPDTFRLLEGGPRERRQFIDWGAFHLDTRFIHHWQRFQRALKQRNHLLRHGRMDVLQLRLWEAELATHGEAVDQLRGQLVAALRPIFEQLLSALTEISDLKLGYSRGWDKQTPLAALLEASRSRDQDQGFTQSGPQRADLRLTRYGRPAVEMLSRGQQKLVVSALKLAQGQLLETLVARRCLYLVDDLPSELDLHHRALFCEQLKAQAGQVMMTTVETESLRHCLGADDTEVAWFHVEHGQISPAKPFMTGVSNE